jgi:DNA-binding HxlR family transcriptional regulator
MPLSKLDKYLNILEALIRRPREFDQISFKTTIECTALKRYLNFLVLHDLIEERPAKDKLTVYAITERGLSVFKTLRALKYLEKLKDNLPIVEEAREIAPLLSRRSQERKEE